MLRRAGAEHRAKADELARKRAKMEKQQTMRRQESIRFRQKLQNVQPKATTSLPSNVLRARANLRQEREAAREEEERVGVGCGFLADLKLNHLMS